MEEKAELQKVWDQIHNPCIMVQAALLAGKPTSLHGKGVGMAAGMPVWRDAHTGCSKQDMQRETLRRFPVHYKLCQPLSGRAFSKQLSEDFINTAAAGTAQGLNLKHVLLWLKVLMHLVNIWIRPAPSRPFFSPRAVGLSGGEGSLKADSVLQGCFHSSASPRDNLAVRSVA